MSATVLEGRWRIRRMMEREQGREGPERTSGFDWVAWCYEWLARVYSLGLIPRSKSAQLEWMSPGDRVLYVGVGSGEDAELAAWRECEVTCVDLSGRMLDRVRARFERAGLPGTFLRQDVFDLEDREGYDVVAANYFLNSFAPDDMLRMLRHLSSFVREGGYLLIADVAPPQGNWLFRLLGQLHVRFAFYLFWLLRLIPYSPTYDYREYLEACGLKCEQVKWFRLFGYGPITYQCLVARKPQGNSNEQRQGGK